MSNPKLDGLPPEMQARIAQIMAGAAQQPESPHQAAIAQPQQQAPVVKPPSLMDHVIALRQEVAALRQETNANSNVVEAVGQAVGQLYQMFQQTPETAAPSPTYSQNFQQQAVDESDY